MRRSSKSQLKSVALEMLRQEKGGLGKGIEPAVTHKLMYEGLRQILLDDYRDKGRLVMDGEDPVITGRRGHLRALDDYFAELPVSAIGSLIRNFVNDRKAAGIGGPTINRNLAYLRRMFKLAERQGKVHMSRISQCKENRNHAKDSWSVRTSSAFAQSCRNTFTRA